MQLCETTSFNVCSAKEPHVSRDDGGHLVILPKISVVNRWDLSASQSFEFMQLTMLVGKSMRDGLIQRGIDIRRINFQDNGNWALDTPSGPKFHLHLYGRSRNSVLQQHGEALSFPKQDTQFWNNITPLNSADVQAIQTQIENSLTDYPDLRVIFPNTQNPNFLSNDVHCVTPLYQDN